MVVKFFLPSVDQQLRFNTVLPCESFLERMPVGVVAVGNGVSERMVLESFHIEAASADEASPILEVYFVLALTLF